MNDRVGDFRGGRVHPREVAIGRPGRKEIGGAVRHADQIGRVQRPRERRETGTRYRNTLDRFRRDVCFFRRIGRRLDVSENVRRLCVFADDRVILGEKVSDIESLF